MFCKFNIITNLIKLNKFIFKVLNVADRFLEDNVKRFCLEYLKIEASSFLDNFYTDSNGATIIDDDKFDENILVSIILFYFKVNNK